MFGLVLLSQTDICLAFIEELTTLNNFIALHVVGNCSSPFRHLCSCMLAETVRGQRRGVFSVGLHGICTRPGFKQ